MVKGLRIGHKYTLNEVCFVLFASVLLIMAVCYCDMTDYAVYYRQYVHMAQSGRISTDYAFEAGYSLVSSIFATIGVPFNVYYGIYMGVALFFLYRFIWKNLKNKTYCLFIFIIFPFINYLQQIRSVAGFVMILNALDSLYYNRTKKGYIKFLIWILIAASFQVTNLGYAVLIIVPFFSYTAQKRWSIAVMLILPAMAFLFYDVAYNIMSRISILNRIMYNLPEERTLTKFSLFNLLIFTVLMFLVVYIVRISHKILTEKTLFFVKAALLIIMLQVLVCLSDNAYRLAVIGLPLVYVALLRVADETRSKFTRMLIYVGILIFAGITMFMYWGPVNPDMYKILTEYMWKVRPY